MFVFENLSLMEEVWILRGERVQESQSIVSPTPELLPKWRVVLDLEVVRCFVAERKVIVRQNRGQPRSQSIQTQIQGKKRVNTSVRRGRNSRVRSPPPLVPPSPPDPARGGSLDIRSASTRVSATRKIFAVYVNKCS